MRRAIGGAWVGAMAVALLVGVTDLLLPDPRAAIARDGGGARGVPEPPDNLVEYGRLLIAESPRWMGPDHPDPALRLSGNRLRCASCHLEAGGLGGYLSLLQTDPVYPRFSGRDGVMGDLALRITGCMERSMNGRAPAPESREMRAMVAYIRDLNRRFRESGPPAAVLPASTSFRMPERAADAGAGEAIYQARCAVCHGVDGMGARAVNSGHGYVFPPLWGEDTYNDGAGMTRVLTAARFIKAWMPYGARDLTDEEAFDVAAFINTMPRARMDPERLAEDYPDRSLKPVDSPYPPWGDPFPAEQHRIGPFRPILDFHGLR